MSKMFEVKGKRVLTWNPITGCTHKCKYCWATKLAEGKLKDVPRYKNGFIPTIIEAELKKSLTKNETYFVSSMGDMWCEGVPTHWIKTVINRCKEMDKSITFMFLTKNPERYVTYFTMYPEDYQDNFILGATIETDLDPSCASEAPNHVLRWICMCNNVLKDKRKFISIEPIIDFNLDNFTKNILDINPEFVYVGYDNYSSGLHEPDLRKVKMFITNLSEAGIEVRIKTLREAKEVKPMGEEQKPEEKKPEGETPKPSAQPTPQPPQQPPLPDQAEQIRARILIENVDTKEVKIDAELKDCYYKFLKRAFFKQQPVDAYEKGEPLEIEKIGVQLELQGIIIYPDKKE